MKIFISLTFIVMTIFFYPQSAYSEWEWADDHDANAILYFENDCFARGNHDKHLTNVITLRVSSDKIPKFLESLFASRSRQFNYDLSQYIYTPDDLKDEELIEEDRPYAGWLYVRFTLYAKKKNVMEVVGIDLGVVGPLSFAEETQKFIHQVIGSTMPQGWEHQLKNEPGVNAFYHRLISFRKEIGDSYSAEFIPRGTVTVGNVHTNASIGAMYRLGYNVPDDMGVYSYTSGADNTRNKSDKFSLYMFIDHSATWVVRNIFLDGNSFTDSHSVEKNDWLYSFSVGVAFRYKKFEIRYSHGFYSREFVEQEEPDIRGSLLFIYRF